MDLGTGSESRAWGTRLGRALERGGRWHAIYGDSLEKRLSDLEVASRKACKDFQCGFDAGNALQAQFVWFGTLTSLPGMHAYTFHILHVPTAQVVWTEAGEVLDADGEAPLALRETLDRLAAGVDPQDLDLRRTPRLGLMAVMDAGDNSAESRVLAERAQARLSASRSFDVIGQREFHDLLQALEFTPDGSDGQEEMLALGRKLDVRYLLRSRLGREADRYRLKLTLFDVMKRIAAPMVGGVITSVLMELAVYPAIYLLWRGRKLRA